MGNAAIPVFDSHLHIIDQRYPLVANQGYLPAELTCQDYLVRTRTLGITGGAVVSGSFQTFDQTYLVAALQTLGPTFVGVTQLPAVASDAEIQFGTDLPSTRASRPFREQDLVLIMEVLDPVTTVKVLYDNAVALYRPHAVEPAPVDSGHPS